ncbi:CBM35 domain-containing protein [Streptomyces sp. NPDC097619]|uniref:CBM35 domain-containing protein n=1 Tax=Streptomyces sp. NPDC097619 TaxID=3157228 RepID=UPI003322FC56
MTTPADNGPNNGANTPADDDPFGYLYADGQANGATPPAQAGGYGYPGQAGGQPGVPRTSYNQVRTVGERTYGGQRGAAPGQVPLQPPYGQQQPQPGYPQPQYPAPETLQAGGYGVPPQQSYAQPAPPQRGSSRKGLLIGAVAVVGAVVIGIGVALLSDKDKDQGDGTATGPSDQVSEAPETPGEKTPGTKPSKDAEKLPKADAASGPGLALTGGASVQNTVPGAKGAGGQYVGGFNQVGASVTWTVDLPSDGDYTLFVNYAVPGKDADATLTINGKVQSRAINLKNWAGAGDGDWEKGWTNSYSWIELAKGTNSLKLSCESSNKCDAVIDQLRLAKGHVKG